MNNKIGLFYEESVPQTLCCCRLSAVLWVSLSVAGGHWALNPDSPSRCAHQLGLHKSSLSCAGCCERGHQGRSLSTIFRTKAVSHLDRVGLKPEKLELKVFLDTSEALKASAVFPGWRSDQPPMRLGWARQEAEQIFHSLLPRAGCSGCDCPCLPLAPLPGVSLAPSICSAGWDAMEENK